MFNAIYRPMNMFFFVMILLIVYTTKICLDITSSFDTRTSQLYAARERNEEPKNTFPLAHEQFQSVLEARRKQQQQVALVQLEKEPASLSADSKLEGNAEDNDTVEVARDDDEMQAAVDTMQTVLRSNCPTPEIGGEYDCVRLGNGQHSLAVKGLKLHEWSAPHNPSNDAIFALAMFDGSSITYKRFVGSLRQSGYTGDIVLVLHPMKCYTEGCNMTPEEAKNYLKAMDVVAYEFSATCQETIRLMGKLHCVSDSLWKGELGLESFPRPLAVMRHEMNLAFARLYSSKSYLFHLDFRDTFFQSNPFDLIDRSATFPNLWLFEEHERKIKDCGFHRGWTESCWGSEGYEFMKDFPIVCSGSTLGTRDAYIHYETEFLKEAVDQRCHESPTPYGRFGGIVTDQGYHNYLFRRGRFGEGAVSHAQGTGGIVNTLGSMNGKRWCKDRECGSLGDFWKILDKEGYVVDWDRTTRSAVVHQYDRFEGEVERFIDKNFLCRGDRPDTYCYQSLYSNRNETMIA